MVCLYVCVSQVWGDIHPTAADGGHPPDLCRGGDQGQHHKALRPGRHGNGLLRLSPSASEHLASTQEGSCPGFSELRLLVAGRPHSLHLHAAI